MASKRHGPSGGELLVPKRARKVHFGSGPSHQELGGRTALVDAAVAVPPTSVTVHQYVDDMGDPLGAGANVTTPSGGSAEVILDSRVGEVPMDPVARFNCWKAMTQHPYVNACFITLAHYLLVEDIQVKKGGQVQKLPAGERLLLNDVYQPYLMDSLRMIMTEGVLAVLFREDPQRPGARTPYVPVWTDFVIHIINVDGRQVYKYYERRKRGTDRTGPYVGGLVHNPDAVIFDHFGWRPGSDGSVNSVIATLLRHIRYSMHTYQSVATANAIRANPFLAMQRRPDAARRERDDAEAYAAFYADAEMAAGREEDRVREEMSRMDVFMEQQDDFSRRMGEPGAWKGAQLSAAGSGLQGVPLVGTGFQSSTAPQPWRGNYYRVPDDYELVSQQTPAEIRGDLVNQEILHQELISMVMGPPRDIVIASASRVASNVAGVTQTYKVHLQFWKQVLTGILTRVYVYCEAQNIIGEWLSARKSLAREDRRRAPPTDINGDGDTYFMTPSVPVEVVGREMRDVQRAAGRLPTLTFDAAVAKLYELKDDTVVELGFPVTSFIPPAEIWDAYIKGILTDRETELFVRNFHGLDPPDEDKRRDGNEKEKKLLTREQRLQLLGIKPVPQPGETDGGGSASAGTKTSSASGRGGVGGAGSAGGSGGASAGGLGGGGPSAPSRSAQASNS